MNLKNVRKSSHFGDCKQLVLSDQQSKEIQFITMWKSSKFSYFQKQENWKRSAIHPEIDSNVQTDDTNCRHLLSWWLIVSALVHTNVHTHSFDNNCISNGSTVVKKSMPQWLQLLTCMCSRSFFFWLIAKNHQAKPESSSMIVP